MSTTDPDKIAYKISVRRRAARTKTGQFTARHAEPLVVALPEDGGDLVPGTHVAMLEEEIGRHISGLHTKGSPIDRIVIERMGVLA